MMREQEIAARLKEEKHREDRGWAFLAHLPCTIGYNDKGFSSHQPLDCLRTMDAFAMGLWPSRGFTRVGYEIKMTRADFLRELADPLKGVRAYMLCHEFWFALAPGIYQEADHHLCNTHSEFAGWGIIEVPPTGRLKVISKPGVHEPLGMSEAFIAALVRAVLRIAPEGSTAVADEFMMEGLRP